MTQNHAHTASIAVQVDDQRILQLAHETLEIEAAAVRHLREGLSPSFVQAVHAILKVTAVSYTHLTLPTTSRV